jgi:carbonic anhydrase
MVWTQFAETRRDGRARRASMLPACESLENRTVMSSTALTATLTPKAAIKQDQTLPPVVGIITGQVTRSTNNKGLKNVKVQLIDINGNLAQSVKTNAKGKYKFNIYVDSTYVVREVVPKGFAQTTPTFTLTPPSGAMTAGFGASSWTYASGNSNPLNGPVGPYAWDTVAPAGDLPFQSPIGISNPPIDLSSVLSINYNNSVPTQIINNGHQFQIQYPANNPADTISVDGNTFNLAQFHYHDPSETTIFGHGYSMEEHFLNTNAAGAQTVVAVFLQLGPHNSALDPILSATTSLAKTNSTAKITTPINFAGLLPSNLEGWFYQGSLTTPPLSQPVNWFVLSTPITLDFNQLKQYETAAGGDGFLPNNRPVQNTDGRQVNEIDYNVNFQSQFVADLNFVVTPLLQNSKKSA